MIKQVVTVATAAILLAGCDPSGGTWIVAPAGSDDGANGVKIYRAWETNGSTGEVRMCSYTVGDGMGVTCSQPSQKP